MQWREYGKEHVKGFNMNVNFSNLDSMNKLTLNTRMPFGKYKGTLVKDIVNFDSDYIIFLYKENRITPDSELSNMIRTTIKQKEKEENDTIEWENIFGTQQDRCVWD